MASVWRARWKRASCRRIGQWQSMQTLLQHADLSPRATAKLSGLFAGALAGAVQRGQGRATRPGDAGNAVASGSPESGSAGRATQD